MQIHELTQPRKPKLDEGDIFSTVGDAIKTGGATIGWSDQAKQARQSAEQERLNTRATKALGKLEKMLPSPEPVPTLDQALSKLKSNPTAQQWINGVVAKWPTTAKQLASLNEAPEYTTPGGIVVPGGAKTAQVPPTQQASQAYTDGFRQWVDGQLKTTKLAELEADSDVASRLDPLLKQIVAAKDNDAEQQKLVRDFFTLAVAANHVVQAKNSKNQNKAQAGATFGQPMGNAQQAAVTGLSAADFYLLNQQAHKAGGSAPTSTGNDWMDGLVQRIWNGR